MRQKEIEGVEEKKKQRKLLCNLLAVKIFQCLNAIRKNVISVTATSVWHRALSESSHSLGVLCRKNISWRLILIFVTTSTMLSINLHFQRPFSRKQHLALTGKTFPSRVVIDKRVSEPSKTMEAMLLQMHYLKKVCLQMQLPPRLQKTISSTCPSSKVSQ